MKKLLVTMTTALITTGVFATPTIYPKDATLLATIVNKTNSNIVADDSDQRVIWVMPPNTAYSKVGGLHSITANVGFCREIADIQSYSRSLTEQLVGLETKKVAALDKLEIIRQQVSDARQDYANHIATNNLHDIEKLDERMTTVEDQISALNEKLFVCQEHCSEIAGQLSELRKERTSLVKERRILVKDRLRSVRVMEQKKASVEAYEKDLEDNQQKFNKISGDLLDMHSRLLGMYKEFAKMEGARASISFESNWEENIQELANNNPGFDFKQIHTENAVIRTSLLTGNSLPGESAVLAYELPGKPVNGGVEYPSYPSEFSGNLRLSLIGACPALHPALFNINVENGTEQMKYGMIVSYEYPTTVEANLHIEYYMKKIYEKIVKSKKKGGFFSSSKKTSVTEKNFFKDEFITTWNEQDAGNSYTEEEKADIEKEIRDDMFARQFALAVPMIPNPGALIAGETGPNGAAVLGTSMANSKACQVNKWCMAATVGVNVLNAVFGSSTSAASYTNIQETRQIVDWNRKKVVMKPWISSYR